MHLVILIMLLIILYGKHILWRYDVDVYNKERERRQKAKEDFKDKYYATDKRIQELTNIYFDMSFYERKDVWEKLGDISPTFQDVCSYVGIELAKEAKVSYHIPTQSAVPRYCQTLEERLAANQYVKALNNILISNGFPYPIMLKCKDFTNGGYNWYSVDELDSLGNIHYGTFTWDYLGESGK